MDGFTHVYTDEALCGLSGLFKKIEVDMQLGERCIWEDAEGLGMGVCEYDQIHIHI